MAKVNKLPEPSKATLLEIVRPCHQQIVADEVTATSGDEGILRPGTICTKFQAKLKGVAENFKKLMSTAEIRRRSLVFWFIFLTVSMVYYGLVFSTNLTSDPFLLVFLG